MTKGHFQAFLEVWAGHCEGHIYQTFMKKPLKLLATKNYVIVIWAAAVKKFFFFSFLPFRRVNYIFHKLAVNTKHVRY
jgi:hypothetical protein